MSEGAEAVWLLAPDRQQYRLRHDHFPITDMQSKHRQVPAGSPRTLPATSALREPTSCRTPGPARRRWARPSTGHELTVTPIARWTDSGRPILVAVREVAPSGSIVIAVGELVGDNLDEFTRWEAETDEPLEG